MTRITCALCLCLLFASLDLTTATAQSETSSVIAQEPPFELEPVVVTATRTEQKVGQSTANVTVLKKDEIANAPAYVVDDLLRQIPGFNTFRRSSSLVTAPQEDPEAQGVTLRGIGPGGASRALVLVDGIPANDAFGGLIYWGELPTGSIERAGIVRGGYFRLWGNFALAGVINLITRMPQERDILAKAAFGNRTTENGYLSYNDKFGGLRFGIEGNAFHTNGWNIVIPNQ